MGVLWFFSPFATHRDPSRVPALPLRFLTVFSHPAAPGCVQALSIKAEITWQMENVLPSPLNNGGLEYGILPFLSINLRSFFRFSWCALEYSLMVCGI